MESEFAFLEQRRDENNTSSQKKEKENVSIFTSMGKKALKYKAINLSQGFPGFPAEEWIIDEVKNSLTKGHIQYAPSAGVPELKEQIAKLYSDHYGSKFKVQEEITITNGATQAIYYGISSLLGAGDEVILFAPFYDSYKGCIELSGAKIREVVLDGPNFYLDLKKIKSLINSKTKLIILNNPHNPTGRVFSKQEIDLFVSVLKNSNAYILSDEVYEFLTYDNSKHLSLCQYPELRHKLLLVSSASKTFGVTGFKVGWIIAEENVTNKIRHRHQNCVFSVCTPVQYALVEVFKKLSEKNYLSRFQIFYEDLRNYFYKGLRDLGLEVVKSEGTYFMLVNFTKYGNSLGLKTDIELSDYLVENYQLASIPLSPFYHDKIPDDLYLRFCFAKEKRELEEGMKKIGQFVYDASIA